MVYLENLQSVLSVTVSVSTILQFLSGVLVCKKIVERKSSGDISPVSFICGHLSTSLWLRYGFLIDNFSVIFVNSIGCLLFLSYTIIYGYYTIKKVILWRQFYISCTVLLLILAYSTYYRHDSDLQQNMGIICCVVTVIFFASPLSSAMYVIKMKNTSSLPFPLIVANFIVATQWYVYGVLLEDQFIQIPNLLGSLLSLFQLLLFCIFPSKKYQSLEDDI
ncbi:sugar transporter SWEET1 [Onthophagus taurus]|uniref:sugar transporter SWEET1 n=1 Tax=Onthophagus taurus TaxID=166361 RepID=UPI000C207FF3|nr:sugar transporter SWEET1 [Onthophagus taurus]XP_022907759.1 sugar transporter SWEET1 [Onthophagus taurus]